MDQIQIFCFQCIFSLTIMSIVLLCLQTIYFKPLFLEKTSLVLRKNLLMTIIQVKNMCLLCTHMYVNTHCT